MNNFQVDMTKYRDACLGYSKKSAERFPAITFKTVAIDFDGTIASLEHDLGNIGAPLPFAKEALREFRSQGWQVIIYTVRTNYGAIAEYMSDHDLVYDAINCNPIDVQNSGVVTMKPFSHLMIDDRTWPMCGVFAGWCAIMSDLVSKNILSAVEQEVCKEN